jgi:hypothetical protein
MEVNNDIILIPLPHVSSKIAYHDKMKLLWILLSVICTLDTLVVSSVQNTRRHNPLVFPITKMKLHVPLVISRVRPWGCTPSRPTQNELDNCNHGIGAFHRVVAINENISLCFLQKPRHYLCLKMESWTSYHKFQH